MKPLLLEMTAFGSYSQKTAIDFTRFHHGLFLITGDTGAGKTTIYDGIVFALYGELSGNERKPAMMHSDLVDRSTDTKVRFLFTHHGHEYELIRTIHYPKSKNGDSTPKFDAKMFKDGAPVTENSRRVNEAVTQILGFNREQFTQIIMLAQGEFKQFLKSDSEGKAQILSRLFDHRIIRNYASLIHQAYLKQADTGKQLQDQMTWLMEQKFVMPEDSDPSCYHPFHPDLLVSLKSLVETDEKHVQQLQKQKEQTTQKGLDLKEKLVQATSGNALLQQLSENEAQLKVLSDQKDDYEALKQKIHTVTLIDSRLLPAISRKQDAMHALQQLEASIAALQKQEDALRVQSEKLQGQKNQIEAYEKAVKEAVEKLTSLQQSKALYEEVESLNSQKQQLLQQKNNTEERIAAVTKQEAVLAETIATGEQQIAGLASLQVSLEADTYALQKCTAEKKRIEDDVLAVNHIMDLQNDMEDLKKKLENSLCKAATAQEEYACIYRRFIDGQTGLLAKTMKKQLKETGHSTCPVCGSHITVDQIDQLAQSSDEIPDRSAVEKKQAAFEKADQQLRTVQNSFASLQAECTAAIESVSERLLPQQKWDSSKAQAALRNQLETDLASITNLQTAIAQKKAEVTRLKQLQNTAVDLKLQLESIRNESVTLQNRSSAIHAQMESVAAQIENRTKSFPVPTEKQLLEMIAELKNSKASMEEQITCFYTQESQLHKQLFQLQGSLQVQKNRLPEVSQRLEEAAVQLKTQLVSCGFEKEDEILVQIAGMDDLSVWIADNTERLNAWNHALAITQQRVSQLKKQTEGMQKQDLERIESDIAEAREQYRRIDILYAKADRMYANHSETYEQAKQLSGKLNTAQKMMALLSKMNDLAMGSNGAGGRLSFERYAMTSSFTQIIEMANARLEILSSGQYQLVHRMESYRKNGSAGLDIEVLDRMSGEKRQSASLSGGESFLVSLSLALGLSDVVRMHSGGQSLDTLFIDEGFGSLDGNVLDQAIQVLDSLSEDHTHLVGIISHVQRLDECIPQKIIVTKDSDGSHITLMTGD